MYKIRIFYTKSFTYKWSHMIKKSLDSILKQFLRELRKSSIHLRELRKSSIRTIHLIIYLQLIINVLPILCPPSVSSRPIKVKIVRKSIYMYSNIVR